MCVDSWSCRTRYPSFLPFIFELKSNPFHHRLLILLRLSLPTWTFLYFSYLFLIILLSIFMVIRILLGVNAA